MFDGSYVVDEFAIILKGLFLVSGLHGVPHVTSLHRDRPLLPG